MNRIFSSSDVYVSPEVQQTIKNALAEMGTDTDVNLSVISRTDDGVMFGVYDEEENFLFTIDTDCVIAN